MFHLSNVPAMMAEYMGDLTGYSPVEGEPLSQEPFLLVATDDERLRNKVRGLSEKYGLFIPLVDTQAEAEAQLAAAEQTPNLKQYVFIDLHSKSFDGYALAKTLKEAVPNVYIIGSSLGVEPERIQQSKLYRIDSLLQRYRFEELLRKLAEQYGANHEQDTDR
jgi:CheY-like chemotaxis protein